MPHAPTPPPGRAWRERELLHAGGPAGHWGSLGLWPCAGGVPAAYANACAALAARVADAAALQPGAQVLCLACGAGEELRWLLSQRGAARVVGVEQDAALVQQAQRLTADAGAQARVLQGDASRPAALGLPPQHFDQVLCVDAAYHLRPRDTLLRQAWALLRPGGWLAYTDLSLEPGAAPWRTPLLRGAAALCGLSARDLLPLAAQAARLQQLGFANVHAEALGEAVLDGFATFVRRQRAQPGWPAGARRADITARLIPPCRAAGLGYVLLAGRKPPSAEATA